MAETNGQLFKEISVWRRLNDETVQKYRCLQALPDGGFCVKSSHFYRYPLSLDDEQIKQAEYYFIDGLFQDGLVELMKETFGTIEEAIAAHEKDFEAPNASV